MGRPAPSLTSTARSYAVPRVPASHWTSCIVFLALSAVHAAESKMTTATNIRDFGVASEHSAADNRAALQEAIDWASARGAALFVEPTDEPYPIAGGLVLKDGDVVAVVPRHDTTLNLPGSSNTRPGGAGYIGTLSGQINQNDLVTRFDVEQLTTVLIRAAGDLRGKDVYLLPTPSALDASSDRGLGSIQLVDTDLVDVAPTFAAPLYADSVIGSIVADVVADRTRLARPVFDHAQSSAVELQRTNDSLIRNLGTGFNRLLGF